MEVDTAKPGLGTLPLGNRADLRAGDFVISDELQASGATTIDRPDGSKQLVMGKWALYYFAGDGAPGDANGQGSKDKWYAIDANCKLVKTAP